MQAAVRGESLCRRPQPVPASELCPINKPLPAAKLIIFTTEEEEV